MKVDRDELDPLELPVDTIPAVLRRAAATWPDHLALADEGTRLTYREYSDRVELLSRALIGSGINKGDRLAIWAPNSIEFAIAAFAIQSTGAAVVPINTRFRHIEAEDILRRAGARGILAFCDFLGRDYLAELAESSVLDNMVVVASLRGMPTKVGVPYQDLLLRADKVSRASQRQREGEIAADTLSDVMFTSGTTGRPKGAMLAHGPSVRGYAEYGRSLALTEHDRLLGIPPFFHTFGLKGGLLAAAIAGAAVVPMSVFDVRDAARLIEKEKVTVLQGSPTVFLDLIGTPGIDRGALRSLRVAAPGAANLNNKYFERIRDDLGIHQFGNGYALTESHAVCTRVYPWDDFETAATSCGRASPGVELRIADESGKALPCGQHGEIQIRGYNVMLGYLDDPESTKAAIDREGWLRTGDVGYLDDQDRLHVVDRKKDMFVVGGFNAYPAEIERLLLGHPDIAEAAVVGVPDVRMGEVGRAYVILREGAQVTDGEVIEFARASMANYKAPREVVIVDQLPRNASGKVLKYRLRDRDDKVVSPV